VTAVKYLLHVGAKSSFSNDGTLYYLQHLVHLLLRKPGAALLNQRHQLNNRLWRLVGNIENLYLIEVELAELVAPIT
jgi:hypothetical protein